MDEIRELIKIVTNHTKRNVPLLDLKNQHPNGNKEMNLFLGLKNGEFNDDIEASNGIYGSEEVDFKFRMLKSRLGRKLLNHLFFMDFDSKEHARSTNLYQEALDYLHFSRMLLNVEEVSLGTKMLYKTLDLAEQCEYTTLVLDCLRALREVYAKTYRPKLFQNIKKRISEHESLLIAEEKADTIFQEHTLSINSSVNNRRKNLEPYETACGKLEALYKQTNSYNIFERFLKMKICYFELKGDFENVLKFVSNIESTYESGEINKERFDPVLIRIAKGNALIKMRKFEEGSVFLEEMLEEVDHTSNIWYSFAEQFVILNLQSSQFSRASEICLRVTNNRSFSDLGEKEMLRWNIFRSYIYVLTGEKSIIRKFNYHSFIEYLPKFDKENGGFHVAILILQFIGHLDGEIEYLHNNLKAIDDYVNKYLNNSYSKRSKTFCKLLRKVVIYNRDWEMITSKCKYLQEKLFSTQVVGNSFIDFEVVPYEYLWENILTNLKEQTYHILAE